MFLVRWCRPSVSSPPGWHDHFYPELPSRHGWSGFLDISWYKQGLRRRYLYKPMFNACLGSYYALFIQTVIDGWYAEWPGAVMDPIKVMCGPASSEITGSRAGAPAPHLQSYCYWSAPRCDLWLRQGGPRRGQSYQSPHQLSTHHSAHHHRGDEIKLYKE